jgi:hypothetical protein
LIALTLAAGVALSACSSAERMAAPAEDVTVTESANESIVRNQVETNSEPPVEQEGELQKASLKGTRVCVINKRTQRDGKPALINVTFTKADRVSQESPYVPPGSQICAEGPYDSSAFSNDIEGVIYTMYDETPKTKLWARNRAIGSPELEIQVGTELCDWIPNTSRVLDDKINQFTIIRLPDSPSFKEFTVTISDGKSSSGCYGAGPY